MKNNKKIKFNKILNNLEEYKTGKPIDFVIRNFGINKKNIINLANNENQFGIDKKVQKIIMKNINQISLYPDDSMYELKTSLAKKFKIKNDNIIIGNGSDQIINFISRALLNNKTKVLTTKTSFAMYDAEAKLCGAKIIKTRTYKHNKEEIIKLSKKEKPRLIYLCTPNNPTGDAIKKEDVFEIINSIDKDIVIVVDGAYMEYANFKNKKYNIKPKDLLKYSNVIYLGTFSKSYGIAGMRIGYGIGNTNIINQLYKIKPPYNVNTLSLSTATEVLKNEDFMKNSIKKNFEEMEKYKIYAQNKSIKYIDSYANFITYFFDNLNSTYLSNELLKKGIIVRNLKSLYKINAIRITIGTKKQNKIFLKEFDKIYNNYKK